MIESIGRFLTGKFRTNLGGLLFVDTDEENLFNKRLLEAKVWCSEKQDLSDPSGSLRSDFLKPALVTEKPWDYGLSNPALEISRLCDKRLASISSCLEEAAKLAGRLLLFWPNESLVCGAAAHTSRGYFDVWNAPPWDTWVWYGPLKNEPAALVSWVPDIFVELVDLGLSVNPEQCIRWL